MATLFLGAGTLGAGSADRVGAAPHVADLQAALRRLQALQPDETVAPGVFDATTALAVQRFQWCAAQVPGALAADGAFTARTPLPLAADGVARKPTLDAINQFLANGWAVTGLLVTLDFQRLRHTRPNTGFMALLNGNARIGVCERGFDAVVAQMDQAAQRLGVFVFVNQLFRVEGSTVSNAIVPPASFSAHKIGRAVDLQLGNAAMPVVGSNPRAARLLMTAADGTAFGQFRQHAKQVLRCRYGGDFDPADPPHFDQQILPGGSATWQLHFFADQLQYRQALRNPAAIPPARPAGLAGADPGA